MRAKDLDPDRSFSKDCGHFVQVEDRVDMLVNPQIAAGVPMVQNQKLGAPVGGPRHRDHVNFNYGLRRPDMWGPYCRG